MAKDDSRAVMEALNTVIQALAQLDDEDRARVLNSASTFFGHGTSRVHGTAQATSPYVIGQTPARPAFSDERAPSPKEFLFQKQPKTDIERITCLAFYLTHFRDTPHFKTLDLAKLNTEAAQVKFSNATYTAENATRAGYLAPSGKAQKQITAWGEKFVAALPDREAASKIISQARQRKNMRRKK
jgi:hypothetical protein